MKNLSLYLNHNTKLAFDGKTYFVKFLDSVNGWLPVQSINYNPVNDTFKVIGIYGFNTGKKQHICNRKGQSVGNTGYTFKPEDLLIDHRIKLYQSSVVTKIETVYPQSLLDEAYTINEKITTWKQYLSLAPNKDALSKLLDIIPEEYKEYIK